MGKKYILLSGGCGFIGSNFIRFFLDRAENINIVNIDILTYAGNAENLENLNKEEKERYTFIHGDIRDAELLEKLFSEYEFDGVIHFAAESHVDRSIDGPEEFIDTNVIGTFRLLEASLKYYKESNNKNFRFLHISTDEVYGSLGDEGAFTEETPYDPSSPYSASKASSDHLVKSYYRTFGLPVLVTNCSNNYGPYQFPEKLIPLIILNILEEKKLPVYGDGSNVRDWLFVDDHCDALINVFEKGRIGDSYNIGGGSEYKNIEIVDLLCDIMDRKLDRSGDKSSRILIEFVKDRPGHDKRYAIDATKIERELGWKASHKFEEAIEKTVDWYLDNLDWVNSVRSGEYMNWFEKNYKNRNDK